MKALKLFFLAILQLVILAPLGWAQSLGTTNLLEGPTASSDSVVLAASNSWTATANDSWLHLSAPNQSGTNSANVIFSFDANAGAARTGTLTIAGQTLTVTQAGSTYVAVTNATTLVSSELSSPYGVAVDDLGNVYIADNGNNAIKEWVAASNTVSTLVSSGLNGPSSVAVDSSGNVYIADTYNSVIMELMSPSNTVITLLSSGLNHPTGVAVDGVGNVYIADNGNYAVKEWLAASNTVIALVSSGLFFPCGVAVDGSGNVYIADLGNGAIKEWVAASNTVITLVSSELSLPTGVAVDGAGNVYIADYGHNAIKEWVAASNTVITLVSSELSHPYGVAVDKSGNVYIADSGYNAIKELPRAFVDTTPKTEPASGGSDSLPAVVPATANLTGPFTPTNKTPWLTITGVTNGVVSFAFTANSSATNRTANITVLGMTVAVTQMAATYSLGTTNLLEGPTAGSDSVVLAANSSWTATANDSWLHLSADNQSGTGSTNVIFTFDANGGATRTGTFTIAGQTLTVIQAGSTYVATTDNGTPAFVDPSPKTETAAAGSDSLPEVLPATADLTGPSAPVSDSVWLTITGVTNGVVSFAFTANYYASRTAHIGLLGLSIAVTQMGPPSYAYMGTTNLLEGPNAGSDSVVLAAGSSWTATANDSWLHLSVANQSGTGSANVVFSFDANSGATRTGTLTIAGQTLNVTQAGSTYVAVTNVTAMVTSGLYHPYGVAVDGAGNVFIAGLNNNQILEWVAASNTVITLVSTGLNQPFGVAVDWAGNVFIADSGNNAIKEWVAASNAVITLVSSGLNNPCGVAVDGLGNVFIADTFNHLTKEWVAASNTVITLVSSGSYGIAEDVAGNVYIANSGGIKEWVAASNTVFTLVSSALSTPAGIAVDGSGNVYVAENTGKQTLKEWKAADNSVTTLVSSGLGAPIGVAVDGSGNIYVAAQGYNAIKELPRAFVDITAKSEPAYSGSDSLPVVVPATANLTGPFAPTNNSSWLTITGVTNGVVSFAFTANSSPTNRTANINLLGMNVSVTQSAAPVITGVAMLTNGAFQFGFSNNPGASFTVWETTNLILPLADWTPLGAPVNLGSGQYQFTDPSATNDVQRFYRVTSP